MGKARDASGEVHRALRAQIAAGDYRPGAPISIQELAEVHRASATPVREALARLLGAGLIRDARARGYAFLGFSHADLSDLYRLQSLVVGAALRDGGPKAASIGSSASRTRSMREVVRAVVEGSHRPALICAHAGIDAILGVAWRAEVHALPGHAAITRGLDTAIAEGDPEYLEQLLRAYDRERQSSVSVVLEGMSRL